MEKKEKKMELHLYRIDTDYVKYLKKIEPHVQDNYENNSIMKPYVGIILKINGKNFYAPLTSPKKKHQFLKNADPTTFKIIYRGKLIGSILLNNMIPVNKDCLTKVDIKSERPQYYKELLRNQSKIISANADIIRHKANLLYKAVIENNSKYFKKISVDFKKLEAVYDNYHKHDFTKSEKKQRLTFKEAEKILNKYIREKKSSKKNTFQR